MGIIRLSTVFQAILWLRCFWGRKNWKLKFFYIFATYIQIIIRIMKNLVEKINAEYEVFVSNANAQVEKGNKAAGTRARKAALELNKLMKEFRKVSVEASK